MVLLLLLRGSARSQGGWPGPREGCKLLKNEHLHARFASERKAKIKICFQLFLFFWIQGPTT